MSYEGRVGRPMGGRRGDAEGAWGGWAAGGTSRESTTGNAPGSLGGRGDGSCRMRSGWVLVSFELGANGAWKAGYKV